ncbi:hypothetical protein [Methylobacterium oxalidis]|uniref:hypothetical protein n=1 Tax=Methylobacterium oxalidis TaxID=944322 RepID=UPI0014781FAF|nr:hypothetical protein [Methylobacterium oxalidis]
MDNKRFVEVVACRSSARHGSELSVSRSVMQRQKTGASRIMSIGRLTLMAIGAAGSRQREILLGLEASEASIDGVTALIFGETAHLAKMRQFGRIKFHGDVGLLLRGWPLGLELRPLILPPLLRVGLVDQHALHALVEIYRRDRLSGAIVRGMSHDGLSVVTQCTGLRGG